MRNLVLVSSILALVACGDGGGGNPDAPPDQPDAGPSGARAVLVAGDFQTTGIVSTLDLPARMVTENAVAGVAGADPVIRDLDDGRLYVVNRFGGDNVTILNKADLSLVKQVSTGAGSNPQDVGAVGTTLVVAALGTPDLLLIDTSMPTNPITTVSLAALDPDDGNPDCNSVYVVGTTAYVACGILDSMFMPRGPGKVAVVNTTLERHDLTIDLPANNPYGQLARTPVGSVYGGDLVVGTVPSFSDFSTGCLVRISTGNTPTATCAETNMALGGYVSRAVPSPEGDVLWLAVAGFTPAFEGFGSLQGIDLGSGDLWPAPISPSQQVIVDVAACPGGFVVAADKTMGMEGVRVWAGTAEATTAPLSIGLPPGTGGNIVCYAR
jgi:hypothetical protein